MITFRMGQNRHEIRITFPPGNDVPVQVTRQLGTAALPWLSRH